MSTRDRRLAGAVLLSCLPHAAVPGESGQAARAEKRRARRRAGDADRLRCSRPVAARPAAQTMADLIGGRQAELNKTLSSGSTG
jgi:hypothetical protein